MIKALFSSNPLSKFLPCCVLVCWILPTTALSTTLEPILAKHCRFSGTFTQEKSLRGLPIPLKSSGQFLFDCDLGLIWQTTKPITETKIYTQSSRHFQLNSTQELEALDDVIQMMIAKLLLDIMNADQAAISKNFSIKALDTHRASLHPINTFIQKGLKSLTLEKKPQENTLSIELIDQQEQHTHIQSTEAQRSDSKAQSLTHCRQMFRHQAICDILQTPENYEPSLESSS